MSDTPVVTSLSILLHVAPRIHTHLPALHVLMPGHWALLLHPGTQTPPTQISPEPSLPGLHAPSLEQP